MDRRQHTRFDLSAPVTYFWKEQGSIRRAGRGTTRDVSECGLFVVTDSFPPAGAVIEFEVSFSFRDDSQIQMKAKGEVVRVDANGNAAAVHGFAAATKVLWLCNPAFNSAGGLNAEL
ncbi:MAG: PilZ domain-containing protein [Candidatus Acidiferrales bacterium]